ncbi:class I SAM-dependent methyltransferase [Paenibacillus mucilaginosus]|uniref:Methyltransferase type 11 n=1 Tax=Paenibacillus mucilaginosus (strain KNP414) TaxID=1036673 RepID=F8FFC3_PAEMK|nr:class I SAM-dependent methyltransferase [Paenibacillus mucilaginosus]AEI41841.1 Methyltransferase type 11 [Paenibacillus mucilaginosus KNP414]MCG7214522.1 class I SAM-dependent methyltransferase [Paenibacillus mucilaginosus]
MTNQDVNDMKLYDRVGRLNGWDFSRVRCLTEGARPDLYVEASCWMRPESLMLDIGTGGGEAALQAADRVRLLVGIDRSAGMIDSAKAHLARVPRPGVRFLQMAAEELVFPEAFFDLITCRHAPFSAEETYRVLAPGGVFVTQQVGEGDKNGLKAFFGRGQSAGIEPGTLLRRYERELSAAGFREIEWGEWDAAEYYERYEDLLFLLLHTPIIPDFGKQDGDEERLRQYVERYGTVRGIRTSASRFRMKAVK